MTCYPSPKWTQAYLLISYGWIKILYQNIEMNWYLIWLICLPYKSFYETVFANEIFYLYFASRLLRFDWLEEQLPIAFVLGFIRTNCKLGQIQWRLSSSVEYISKIVNNLSVLTIYRNETTNNTEITVYSMSKTVIYKEWFSLMDRSLLHLRKKIARARRGEC